MKVESHLAFDLDFNFIPIAFVMKNMQHDCPFKFGSLVYKLSFARLRVYICINISLCTMLKTCKLYKNKPLSLEIWKVTQKSCYVVLRNSFNTLNLRPRRRIHECCLCCVCNPISILSLCILFYVTIQVNVGHCVEPSQWTHSLQTLATSNKEDGYGLSWIRETRERTLPFKNVV